MFVCLTALLLHIVTILHEWKHFAWMGIIGYRCDFVVVWMPCYAVWKEMEGDGEIIISAFGYGDDS